MSEMDEVEASIQAALAMPMRPPKARRARAARLADLYEVRVRLFAEAQADEVIVPATYRAACELAAKYCSNQVTFWRTRAGER